MSRSVNILIPPTDVIGALRWQAWQHFRNLVLLSAVFSVLTLAAWGSSNKQDSDLGQMLVWLVLLASGAQTVAFIIAVVRWPYEFRKMLSAIRKNPPSELTLFAKAHAGALSFLPWIYRAGPAYANAPVARDLPWWRN